MAKYGNHLNTIIKQATALYTDGSEKNDLSDLPEVIRPYQYNCGNYNVSTHDDKHNEPHTKVGFIGNQDMAYYFDFPGGNTYVEGSYIKQIKGIIESLETRSPTILRSYLEDGTELKAYKISNFGNQSMSFSFGDYDVDVYINKKNLNEVKTIVFFMYYYPTQTIYIFFDSSIDTWSDKNLYLKFTPRSKAEENDQFSTPMNTMPLKTVDHEYKYCTNPDDDPYNKIKDISSYQIYKCVDGEYLRVPNELIKSIKYSDTRTLNDKQISYFTNKTTNSNYIELQNRYVEIEFENVESLKNKENLYLVKSDTTNLTKTDSISNDKIIRHTGCKTLIKTVYNDKISNIVSKDKNTLIYSILKNENLIYQDHLYFDINSATIYFENLGTSTGQYLWMPCENSLTLESIGLICLRIDYYLNDIENELDDDNAIGNIKDYFVTKTQITQDNTNNAVFFNYDDTFQTIDSDDIVQCDDVVFVKDSNDNDSDEIKNDTTVFKKTISEDFVINEDDLSYKIVENELKKEDPGSTTSTPQSNEYKSNLYSQITGQNIVSYSKALVDDLNGTNYNTLSSNIKNISSFLNISMDDGDDVQDESVDENILSFLYNSNHDYFILKNMTDSIAYPIKSIYVGNNNPAHTLAANTICIDLSDVGNTSYLPFIQYLGQDLSGHPTWYIPTCKDIDSESQIDIVFSNEFTMNTKGFYF